MRRAPPQTTTTRVLIVEDEPDIAALLRRGLVREGYKDVVVVSRGDTALESVRSTRPAVILLDLTLPGLDGIDVCRILRHSPATVDIPIMILTARASEDQRVDGLDIGADDYITKPFSVREVVARVRAVLRRQNRGAEPTARSHYQGAHLDADFDAAVVEVDGQPVRLTRRELDLLRYLVENRGRVASRDRLLEQVWGYSRSVETRSVDVHVARLRQKLGSAGRQIETLIGLGYRFDE